jgi:hypothetical protein
MNPPTSSLILKKLVQIALGIAVFVALWQLIVVGFKIPKY